MQKKKKTRKKKKAKSQTFLVFKKPLQTDLRTEKEDTSVKKEDTSVKKEDIWCPTKQRH